MAASTEQLTPWAQALAGALGAVFSNATVYPLDTVKTRIQAAPTKAVVKGAPLSVLSELLQIFNEEGIIGFYGGFTANILNTFQTQYIYFFFYSFIRKSWMKRIAQKLPVGAKPPVLSTAVELLLGALAGALAQIFTLPVSVIATRQQVAHYHRQVKREQSLLEKPSYASVADPNITTSANTSEADNEHLDNSFFAVARQIIHEEGITGLWLGLKPSLVLTVNPAITYGVFERIKSAILLTKQSTGGFNKMTPWQAFFIGALSKTLATVVTYPYIMAKVKIQAGTEGTEVKLPTSSGHTQRYKHIGAVTLLKKVLKEQGIVGWYQGMGAQITKAVLSQALLFMSKDQFEHYALLIIALYTKALRKRFP